MNTSITVLRSLKMLIWPQIGGKVLSRCIWWHNPSGIMAALFFQEAIVIGFICWSERACRPSIYLLIVKIMKYYLDRCHKLISEKDLQTGFMALSLECDEFFRFMFVCLSFVAHSILCLCSLHYLDLQRMQNVCMMILCSSQYLCSLLVALLKLAKKTDCCGSFWGELVHPGVTWTDRDFNTNRAMTGYKLNTS